jgi:hypothetical protein
LTEAVWYGFVWVYNYIYIFMETFCKFDGWSLLSYMFAYFANWNCCFGGYTAIFRHSRMYKRIWVKLGYVYVQLCAPEEMGKTKKTQMGSDRNPGWMILDWFLQDFIRVFSQQPVRYWVNYVMPWLFSWLMVRIRGREDFLRGLTSPLRWWLVGIFILQRTEV